MAMNIVARLNAPYDVVGLGDGRIMAFCFLGFDTNAVGAIAGTTYDPTDHLTTSFQRMTAGKTIFDVFGMKHVEQVEFHNGSSDQQLKSAAATSTTGECKCEFVESGQYIKLKVVGGGGADPLTMQDELELDGTAAALNALFLQCAIIGRASQART